MTRTNHLFDLFVPVSPAVGQDLPWTYASTHIHMHDAYTQMYVQTYILYTYLRIEACYTICLMTGVLMFERVRDDDPEQNAGRSRAGPWLSWTAQVTSTP